MIKLLRLVLREELCFCLPVSSVRSRTHEDVVLSLIEVRPCILLFFLLELCRFLANNEVTPGGSDRTGAQTEAITLKLLVFRFLPSPVK